MRLTQAGERKKAASTTRFYRHCALDLARSLKPIGSECTTMKELSHADAFEVLCLQAADEGRGPALFGDCVGRARSVASPFMVGRVFPATYLEFPLLGDPFLDVTVLYGKLDPGTRIDSPIAGDVDALLDWSAARSDGLPGVSFGFELDTSKEHVPLAAIHFQPRTHDELVRPFLEALGEGERADVYFDLASRLPEGWRPEFFGLFRGRPDAPLRVCGYLSDEEQELCARDPGRLAEVLARAGFSAASDTMLAQAHELVATASGDVDYQLDIYPDGTLGDTFAFDVGFEVETPQAVRDSFCGGPASRVMRLLEGWGIADKRWQLIPQATFARSLPVERENGETARYSFTLMPGWAKVRWQSGELQPSKFYFYAQAGIVKSPTEHPSQS
ncbi:MAG: hypothetical protein Q4B54_04885 [Coriobacteriales bacterium]|nr:hypothetical protein [Coriobacteriales bacterium]